MQRLLQSSGFNVFKNSKETLVTDAESVGGERWGDDVQGGSKGGINTCIHICKSL